MQNKIKIFFVILMIVAFSAPPIFAQEVDGKEAKAMNKAADKIAKIADDVGPAEDDFQKAAEALNVYIDKAYKNTKFSKKEISEINALTAELKKQSAALKAKCIKVADNAEKNIKVIAASTD